MFGRKAREARDARRARMVQDERGRLDRARAELSAAEANTRRQRQGGNRDPVAEREELNTLRANVESHRRNIRALGG